MSISRNKRLVLDFYEAGARGDMGICLDLLADNVKWTNIGSTRFSGTFTGKQALDAQERPTECHQLLIMAGLTANSQEAMLKPVALQILIKFPANESG